MFIPFALLYPKLSITVLPFNHFRFPLLFFLSIYSVDIECYLCGNPLRFVIFHDEIIFLQLPRASSCASIWLFFTFFLQLEIIFLFWRLCHLIQIKYWYLVRAEIGFCFHLIRIFLLLRNAGFFFSLGEFFKEWDINCFFICFIDLFWVLLDVFMPRSKLFYLFWAFYFSILSVLPRGFLQHRYPGFTWSFDGSSIGIGNSISKSW